MFKQCLICKENKPLIEFYKDRKAKDGHRCYCQKCDGEKATKYNRVKGHLPMADNKLCTSYLGIAIAERLVGHLFTDIVKMPNNNSGYDFICGKGKKIDVKSACVTLNNKKNPCWHFDIKKNKIADYLLLLAFNSRADLEPLHQWLVPGEILNHFTGVTISLSTISKWDQYKQPIGPALACCSALKE